MIGDPAMQAQFRKRAKPERTAAHPMRAEMLAVLADARVRIDRINAPVG